MSSDRVCCECGKTRATGESYRHPAKTNGRLCVGCWKRLVWRPRGGEAVERDRQNRRLYKQLHPDEVRAYNAAYEVARAVPCIECRAPAKRGATHCRRCYDAAQRRVRDAILHLRRDEHLNNRQISQRLGMTEQAVANQICRMRKAGIDVPPSPHYRQARGQVAA